MFKTPKFQLVELVIPASVAGALLQTAFQAQPQLQSQTGDQQVFIKGVEVFSNKAISSSPLTANNAVAAPIDIANATLTLCVNGKNWIKNIPLTRLVQLQDNTGGDPNSDGVMFLLKNTWKIDWTQSFVTTILNPAGGGGLTAPPFSYLFGFHYDYAPDADDLTEMAIINAAALRAGQSDPKNWIAGS